MENIKSLPPWFLKSLNPTAEKLEIFQVTLNQIRWLNILLCVWVGVILYWGSIEPRLLFLLPVGFTLRLLLRSIEWILMDKKQIPVSSSTYLVKTLSETALLLPLAFTPYFHTELMVMFVILSQLLELTHIDKKVPQELFLNHPLSLHKGIIFSIICILTSLGVQTTSITPWILIGLNVLLLKQIYFSLK